MLSNILLFHAALPDLSLQKGSHIAMSAMVTSIHFTNMAMMGIYIQGEEQTRNVTMEQVVMHDVVLCSCYVMLSRCIASCPTGAD